MKLKTLLKVIPGMFNIDVLDYKGNIVYSGLKWDVPKEFKYLDHKVNVVFGVTKHGDRRCTTSVMDDSNRATRLSIQLKGVVKN